MNVCGDTWLNPKEVHQMLLSSGSAPVKLDLRSEGPSLAALGITDLVLEVCRQVGKDPRNIEIVRWPNRAESVPFCHREHGPSHFWFMSDQYWRDPIPCDDRAYRFAFFLGRRTWARATIMKDCMTRWRDHCLVGAMPTVCDAPWQTSAEGAVSLDRCQDWLINDSIQDFQQWWTANRPEGIDGMSVQDQYRPGINTNSSLLDHYGKFNIEIVAETYTMGNTFFPTEKTVRPMMAYRPMLVYGSPGYLQRLKHLGFRTFHGIWDETYDQYQGPRRWAAMRDVLDDLAGLEHEKFQDLIRACRSILKHNRKHIVDIKQRRVQV